MKKRVFIAKNLLRLALASSATGTHLFADSHSSECKIPKIIEQSKNDISIYQGDRVLLRIKACGDGLKYEWAFSHGGKGFQTLACGKDSCLIETATLSKGRHEIHVSASNAQGASFSNLFFHVLDRPAKAMESRTVEADLTGATDAVQAALPELHGKVHDNSAYGRGIQNMAEGDRISAKTQLSYSLWNEPQNRDRAELALNEVKRQERWTASLHFGVLQDSNFLLQGSSDASSSEETPPRSRLGYILAPEFALRVFRGEKNETQLKAGFKREANFKLLSLFGMNVGGSETIEDYNQNRFDLGLRHAFYSSETWEQSGFMLAAEASASQLQTGGNVVDSGLGVKVEVGSPALKGSPKISMTVENHQDIDSEKATPIDPVTGELNPWSDHSGSLQRFGLELNVWRRPTSQVLAIWQQETWKHNAGEAKAGDYSALRFQAKGQFRIGLKQAISANLGMEGRLHSEAVDARLDRKVSISGSWSWYTYPYLYRSLTILSESNQSNRTSAQYQRIVLMLSGSLEI